MRLYAEAKDIGSSLSIANKMVENIFLLAICNVQVNYFFTLCLNLYCRSPEVISDRSKAYMAAKLILEGGGWLLIYEHLVELNVHIE